MTSNKKRSRGRETEMNFGDDGQKFRKKRSKIQLEQDNFRSLLSQVDKQTVGQALVEIFVKMLKSSLFMHQSRLEQVHSLLTENGIEDERLKGVCQLLDILHQPPAAPSFLSDVLLMFLEPEEALELQCFEQYRSRVHGLEILLKLQQHQRMIKGKMASKAPLKTLRDSDQSELDSNALYGQFIAWINNDPRLRDIITPLFPDQQFDASSVSLADMETISSDILEDREADEFEVIDWTDADRHDISAFRRCTCVCHQEDASSSNNFPTGHCGLCAVKFFDEHVYVWRGNRLVRAQISFSDPSGSVPEEKKVTVDDGQCAVVTPSKLSGMSNHPAENCNWNSIFRMVDTMENEPSGSESAGKRLMSPRRPPSVCRKLWPNDDSTQDVLKQAFVETFGRSAWGRGFSPMKRPGQHGLNEESNSTSFVFVRGFDGANTMFATAVDSNSAVTPPRVGHQSRIEETSRGHPINQSLAASASTSTSGTFATTVETDYQEEQQAEDTWTEEQDRYLLEQFKLHRNIYQAGIASMANLSKPLHAVRDRLKLLLDLLKETM